ncbi:hypothetical protein FKW77_008781 [Venturia effusa]|uniref:Uncharacterized protein n=1 Tax=Venturia effusa TaxID=50376 RepID=A0A517LCY7_9PEZI|nr:hypothetical protein FKW77_008781 [Venturia effusa]
MYSSYPFALATLFYHFAYIKAYSPQQLLWNFPNGKKADFYRTYINTEIVLASWNDWNSTSDIDASTTLVDLWITCAACDQQHVENPSLASPSEASYSKQLKKRIDLRVADELTWTVDIPDEQLSITPKYVLRFKPADSSFNASTPDLPSPAFLVIMNMGMTSSSSPSSSTTPSSSSLVPSPSISISNSSSTTTTLLPSASLVIAMTTPKALGLSTEAKIGLCVGLFFLVLVICSLLAVLSIRRSRHQRELMGLLKSVEEKRCAEAFVDPSSAAQVLEVGESNPENVVSGRGSGHNLGQPIACEITAEKSHNDGRRNTSDL